MIIMPPEVERINRSLVDEFGIDSSTGQAIWRIVWSDDQYEKRLMYTTDEGLSLLYPEVREVPKYKQWLPHLWVLERLVIIPFMNMGEIPSTKLSYEPMFPFWDKAGNPLPPNYIAAKFVIDSVYAAQGKGNLTKYSDPEATQEGQIEAKRKRVDELTEAIYGDETEVTDHLSRQTGIIVPQSYNNTKES